MIYRILKCFPEVYMKVIVPEISRRGKYGTRKFFNLVAR